MKLVELLVQYYKEWPKGIHQICQSAHDQELYLEPEEGFERQDHYVDWWADDAGLLNYVNEDQWQAERDRQKGGEWKRRRGGKQPVDCGVMVEIKQRNSETETNLAERFIWVHDRSYYDIMQYRIISQPQAEEVEIQPDADGYRGPFPTAPIGDQENVIKYEIEFPSGVCSVEAKTEYFDGPLRWRDTIIHCQAIIEDCEREIQRNVDLLDAEGLMMQTDSKKAMQHYAMSAIIPIEEWQVGDIIEVVRESSESCAEAGRQYPITDIDDVDPRYELDGTYYPLHTDMKFIRRP